MKDVRRARTRIGVLTIAALWAGTSAALATPGGSTEQGNEVDCGVLAPGGALTVNEQGIEACQDGAVGPIRGRVIVSAADGYIAFDGDRRNPVLVSGYQRVDEDGTITCGEGDAEAKDRIRAAGIDCLVPPLDQL